MKKAFVFFTNRSNLASSPISINTDGIGEFDNNNNNDILIISKEKGKQTITITGNLPEITAIPYFVLIKDTISLPNPTNNEETLNCKKLQTILSNYDEIYLVIHSSNPSNCLVTFQRIFPDKLKSHIYQSHVPNSIYYRVLKTFLDINLTDLSLMETEITKEFPNSQLESLIRLHKTLSISLISNPSISIEKLKSQEKYKLAFELLNEANNIKAILELTSSKIIEHSKA